MGTDFSKDITPPPLTLLDCLVDGELNASRYYYYRRQLDNRLHSQRIEDRRHKRKRRLTKSQSVTKKKQRQARTVKKHYVLVRDKDGSLQSVSLSG